MRPIVTSLLLAAAAATASSAAAQSASLRLGSDREAGGKSKGDWIDVQSFKWGETVPTTAGLPPAHELREMADVGSLTIVTRMDPASCKLGAKSDGARLRTAYLDYVLEGVMIACCATGGSSSGEMPLESMSLNYSKVTKDYKAQDSKEPAPKPRPKE